MLVDTLVCILPWLWPGDEKINWIRRSTHHAIEQSSHTIVVYFDDVQGHVSECVMKLSLALSGYTDYSAAFYAHDILLLTAAVAIMAMPIGVKLPADDLLRDVWSILKMPHVTVFIFFMFLLGNYWGYIESFLFLYLKELGAPNYLLGKN